MSWLTVVCLAVGLGMDAFAVSLGVSASGQRLSPRARFRLPFHFGLFQFLMPIVGWMLGTTVDQYVKDFDHWVAFGLLALIGGKMIKESFDRPSETTSTTDPTRGWMLLALSVATSIDALAVGLSMSFLRVEVLGPSIVIGLVAGVMTLTGMHLGRRLGERFGRRMGCAGGLVLLAIGVKIVIEHVC